MVELALAAALASGVQRKQVGRATAAFFAAVFPGNVHQYVKHLDASFLNSDQRRLGQGACQLHPLAFPT